MRKNALSTHFSNVVYFSNRYKNFWVVRWIKEYTKFYAVVNENFLSFLIKLSLLFLKGMVMQCHILKL